jgi:hypothetical protein
MRPFHIVLATTLTLMIAGCVSEPAHDAAADDRAIASIVALLAGYDSGGLASTLSDLDEDSLAVEEESAFAIHAAQFGEPSPVRTLVRNRKGESALGESRMRLTMGERGEGEAGTGERVDLEVDARSLHASATLAVRAHSAGRITLVAAGPLRERSSAGELHIEGTIGDRPRDGVPFTRVEVTLSWKRLEVRKRIAGLLGELGVSVAAWGARGLVLRNGTVALDGAGRGLLDLGGRRYALDLARAQTAR